MLTKPAFSTKELTRARTVFINNLKLSKEDARGVAYDLLYRSLYTKEHLAYSYLPEELIAASEKVQVSELKTLHQLIRAHRTTITFAGSEALEKIWVPLVTKHFSGSVIEVHENPAMKVLTPHVVLTEIASKENVELSIGTAVTITTEHKYYPALILGVAVLGKWGGFTGRLMQRVREKQGLTYGIYARLAELTKTEPGFLRIMTFFAPSKIEQGVTSTLKEYRLIIEKGITTQELHRCKTILRTQFALLQDAPTNMVGFVHSQACEGTSYQESVALYESIATLTVREVNRALRETLSPQTLIIAGAGPTTGLRKKLEALL